MPVDLDHIQHIDIPVPIGISIDDDLIGLHQFVFTVIHLKLIAGGKFSCLLLAGCIHNLKCGPLCTDLPQKIRRLNSRFQTGNVLASNLVYRRGHFAHLKFLTYHRQCILFRVAALRGADNFEGIGSGLERRLTGSGHTRSGGNRRRCNGNRIHAAFHHNGILLCGSVKARRQCIAGYFQRLQIIIRVSRSRERHSRFRHVIVHRNTKYKRLFFVCIALPQLFAFRDSCCHIAHILMRVKCRMIHNIEFLKIQCVLTDRNVVLRQQLRAA